MGILKFETDHVESTWDCIAPASSQQEKEDVNKINIRNLDPITFNFWGEDNTRITSHILTSLAHDYKNYYKHNGLIEPKSLD